MKTKIGILVLVFCTGFFTLQAQRRVTTTTRATSYDISDNLDLEAVASIFGDSEDLEDFERRLNNPKSRISNLDLNQDGYIDYLRVLENSSDRNSIVIIQAVLDQDVYQDVATIEIEKSSNYNHRIQIVGDSYIYGSDYIIEPIFVRTPLIFSFFWGPRYRSWHSPYYWNYYPRWYSHCRPYSPFKYHRHIHVHVNRYNSYHYLKSRNFYFSHDNHVKIHRNDFAKRYPDRAFSNRHEGISNRNELIERRPGNVVNRQRGNDNRNAEQREYKYSRKPSSGNAERQRNDVEPRRQSENEKSGQIKSRESSRNVDRTNQEKDRQIQRDNENRNRSYQRSSSSERRTVSTPERSAKRVEAPQRNTAPREKSASVSTEKRATREVKQSSGTSRSSESRTNDDKKESEKNRRR